MHRNVHRDEIANHLSWTAVNGNQISAQRFVPPDDCIERVVKRCNVEGALHAQRHRNVVDWTARLKLLQEPDTLLGKGKGAGTSRFAATDHWNLGLSIALGHQLLLQKSALFW